ncbi:ribonuclease Y [Ruthenibacterium lactatiformans]|uniref:Ribonuclease Y n=1 Tax=Ruthenibacterium lactatiformans TaxID=1550024 RepID=A0A6L6LNH0_9FIRM|nr:ribonuclease Y [Ruthenibacterium lactatiformans]MTQ81348.1 ribonuclease Y [Ruthenibacterium lactatiformans]MTS21986.1 ribonuclease Y [Ruthenibacterium lactatiformans]MTS26240.1 ribonuclease Y [Ruthenibacterium lactatiformans]MTS30654.1 ribonuclease Y [Ruthenibacterium lactatiformans]MTS39491.1 ribonuclease Y [Ruthenibacterium lactatiformans]
MVSPVIAAVIAVVAGVVAAAIAFFAGVSYRRKTAEAKIGSAEEEAKRLINDAMKAAQQKRKESLIEAKDEAFQLKAEADKEIKERRSELSRQERRLDQKEEAMDRKTAVLEQKETDLAKRSELVEARLDEIEQIKARELDKMETIAGLTAEDAKQLLLNRLDEQLTHEKAMHIAAFETQTKDECDTMARELISQAVARCAADHSSEATVSVVPLPSDEMKGRIIGREGRNIRALETATGVDLIIDDTPEAITLSSFDPVRREVARMTLEKLISDGRIHPARIEETVEKCRRELELAMKREGEKAVMDVGVHGIHPDMVKLLGRLRYRTSYGQNVLNHSLEVAYLSGILAAELGVNVTQARRAGLLHDIGKALDHEIEGSHISIGVDIAKKYKENPAIIHAIEAHHGDVEAKTPLAFIVMAADAISAARPGARRENLESYIKRLESLEEIASGFEGVERSFAIQAGREVRIMVKPDAINDDALILLAHSISQKIEETLDYPGQIKVNVIRESRAVDYAK